MGFETRDLRIKLFNAGSVVLDGGRAEAGNVAKSSQTGGLYDAAAICELGGVRWLRYSIQEPFFCALEW